MFFLLPGQRQHQAAVHDAHPHGCFDVKAGGGRHGADLLGRCPFHEDKTPSLVITPAKNLWHCLGACNTGGTVIDWVMKANGVSFRHAVELLRADLPLAASPTKPVKSSTVRHLDAPFDSEADDRAALNQVFGYYHETLKQDAEALAYLEKRGIGSSDAIERFRLGYANRRIPGTVYLFLI